MLVLGATVQRDILISDYMITEKVSALGKFDVTFELDFYVINSIYKRQSTSDKQKIFSQKEN